MEKLGPGAWKERPAEMLRHVRSLDHRLATLAVPFEEWETLYRMRVQLERDALVALTSDGSPDAADFDDDIEPEPRTASRLDLAIGLAGAALIAADLAVMVSNRRRGSDRGPRRP